MPQDMTDVDGRNEDGTSAPPTRNIQKVLENAASQSIPVTLTEAEVNQWLADQVKGSQEGKLASSIKYRGIWVRFKEDSIDLIFEREAFNRTHTIAMEMKIQQTISGNNRMQTGITRPGGRLGQMPVPQGYLLLVMSSFEEFAEVMAPEIKSLEKLLEGSVVTFEGDRVTFKPRNTEVNLGI